jgi:hypothetical protein
LYIGKYFIKVLSILHIWANRIYLSYNFRVYAIFCLLWKSHPRIFFYIEGSFFTIMLVTEVISVYKTWNDHCVSVFMVFNATFNNISFILGRPVLLVEEIGENHRPARSHWQALSHNVLHTPCHERDSNSQR